MIALLQYVHASFIRSYRYAAPAFIYIGGTSFIYSVVPNPVMGSYSFSSTFLYVIAVSIGLIMLELEPKSNEWITAVHVKSIPKLYAAKMIYSWIFTIPLAIFAIIYPILFHKFDRDPLISEIIMALLYHVTLSFLGVTLAGWFCSKLIASRLWAFLSVTLLVVITLSGKGLENLVPQSLKAIMLILPPLYRTMEVVMDYENQSYGSRIVGMIMPAIYGCISMSIFLLIMNKRKLDPPRK